MITLFAVTLIALILFVGIVGIHEIRTTKGRISILRKAIRCVVFCAFCLLITAASISIYYFCSDLWLRVPDARVSIDGRARPDCLVFDRRSEYVVAVPDSVSKRGPVSYNSYVLDKSVRLYASAGNDGSELWGSFYTCKSFAVSYEQDPLEASVDGGYMDYGSLQYSRGVFGFSNDSEPPAKFAVTLSRSGGTGD
jgi:hypothetical protein